MKNEDSLVIGKNLRKRKVNVREGNEETLDDKGLGNAKVERGIGCIEDQKVT